MNKKSAPRTPANTPEVWSQLSVEESHDQEAECFLEASGEASSSFLLSFFFKNQHYICSCLHRSGHKLQLCKLTSLPPSPFQSSLRLDLSTAQHA